MGMSQREEERAEQAAWAARDGATQDFGRAKTLRQLEQAYAKWSKIWDAHPEYNDYVDDEHHWDPIFWERHAELSKPKKRESNLFVAVFQEATGQPPAGWKPTFFNSHRRELASLERQMEQAMEMRRPALGGTSVPPQQTLKSLQAEYKQVLQQAWEEEHGKSEARERRSRMTATRLPLEDKSQLDPITKLLRNYGLRNSVHASAMGMPFELLQSGDMEAMRVWLRKYRDEEEALYRREAFSPGQTGASGVKVLGIHSDKDTCEHCGKRGLKKVVELDHPEHGQKACGVDCAARMVYGKTSAKLASGITAQAEHAERIKKALAWLDEALKTKKAPIHKILDAANNLVANRGAGLFLFQYDSDPTLKVFVIGEKDIAGGRLPQREAATYNLSMLGAILQKTPQDKWRYEWPNTPGFTPADKT